MDLAHVTIPFSSSHPLLPSSTSAPSCNHCRNISGRANSAAPWRHENPWFFFRNDQLEIYLWNLPRFFVEEATLSKPTIIINIYCIGPTHLFFIFISWSKIKSIIKSILYSHPPHRQPKKTFKTKTRKHKKKHSPSDLQSISPLPKKKTPHNSINLHRNLAAKVRCMECLPPTFRRTSAQLPCPRASAASKAVPPCLAIILNGNFGLYSNRQSCHNILHDWHLFATNLTISSFTLLFYMVGTNFLICFWTL